MNVHEFQAKSLFAQFGVPVPRGKEITSPEAATTWAKLEFHVIPHDPASMQRADQ